MATQSCYSAEEQSKTIADSFVRFVERIVNCNFIRVSRMIADRLHKMASCRMDTHHIIILH